jgi:hypothetical protein
MTVVCGDKFGCPEAHSRLYSLSETVVLLLQFCVTLHQLITNSYMPTPIMHVPTGSFHVHQVGENL